MDDSNINTSALLVELQELHLTNSSLKSELSKTIAELGQLRLLLKGENDNLMSIFESSPFGILLMDETTNIVLANEEIIRQMGGDVNEIVNRRPGNALKCVHSSRDPRGCGYSDRCPLCPLRNTIESIVADGGSVSGTEMEMQLVRNNEPCSVWLELGAANIVINGSSHLCVSINEITSRKIAEERLRKNEEHYRLLAEGINDVLWKMDSNHLFTYVSPADERLRGFRSDEVRGHHFSEILTPEGVETANQKIQERLRDEQMGILTECISFQVQEKCKDGSLIWAEVVSTAEHDKNGVISGYHGISRNITEQKNIEIQLQNYAIELSRQIAQKDKFFSIVAHDLRSPFNGIIGFSELLIEKIRSKDFEGIEEYGSIVLQSSKRAMDLLINLMEWSRSQTGRMEFNPEDVDMVSVIKGVTQLFQEIIQQKSLNFQFELPETLTFTADKSMISTIIRNLVSNAIKFSRPGDVVTVSVIQTAKQVNFSIRDTGIGMSGTVMERLFRIDETHSTPGTQKETGTGLGLILCKEFVEKHKGNIWVESEYGKGSTFNFSIPEHKL